MWFILILSSSGDPVRYLKELHSDTGEHELQQRGDNHDVTDGPDGHEDTLDHMLQTRRHHTESIDVLSGKMGIELLLFSP